MPAVPENPQWNLVRDDVSKVLKSGYALASEDFSEVARIHGLAPNTGKIKLQSEINGGYFL